jgi:hypothetical protein
MCGVYKEEKNLYERGGMQRAGVLVPVYKAAVLNQESIVQRISGAEQEAPNTQLRPVALQLSARLGSSILVMNLTAHTRYWCVVVYVASVHEWKDEYEDVYGADG